MSSNFGKKEFFVVSLMLFSMFFGAGNFIFPPEVGQKAGENFYVAILFFCVTAVALPVLGVAAVARAGTLKNLASRADVWFATFYVTAIYISIGPLLAIPRASNMPFAIAIAPYIPNSDTNSFMSLNDIYLLVYSVAYFALNYYICLNPSKMIDTLGKYLTPALLILIAVFFGATLLNNETFIANASMEYQNHAASTAFVAGYQTMDALAALVFGISVVGALKTYGLSKPKSLAINTIKSGILAGAILMIVYIMIGYLGYKFGGLFIESKNGAELLSSISKYLFGDFGRLVLGLAIFLACLTTTLGLIGSAAIYFSSITKISYKTWVLVWSVCSFIVASFGLENILKFSVPILVGLYPVAIVLIVLSLIDNVINSSRLVYRACIYTTTFIGLVNGLDVASISIPFVSSLVHKLPLYDYMLGWILPSFIAFIISYIIYILNSKKSDFDDENN